MKISYNFYQLFPLKYLIIWSIRK